jgi:hypothetical protein
MPRDQVTLLGLEGCNEVQIIYGKVSTSWDSNYLEAITLKQTTTVNMGLVYPS